MASHSGSGIHKEEDSPKVKRLQEELAKLKEERKRLDKKIQQAENDLKQEQGPLYVPNVGFISFQKNENANKTAVGSTFNPPKEGEIISSSGPVASTSSSGSQQQDSAFASITNPFFSDPLECFLQPSITRMPSPDAERLEKEVREDKDEAEIDFVE